MKLIKYFTDGSELCFDMGSFDNWCVYLKRPGFNKYAPHDIEYFTQIQQLARFHGFEKIYNHIVGFYVQTKSFIDPQIVSLISEQAQLYKPDQLEIEILFMLIYAGMVAEENKEKAILKKRIKRLGIHQLLIDKLTPEMAANFSRGKKWTELNQICIQKGF